LLELEAQATEAQIKDAYRVLVKVWHPDRFQGDAKLKQAAEEKLKTLNAAYVFLTGKADAKGSRPGKGPGRAREAKSGTQPQPQTVARTGRGRRRARMIALLATCAVLVCGLLIAALFFKAVDSTLASDPTTGRIYTVLRNEAVGIFRETLGTVWSGAGHQMRELIPAWSTAEAQTPAPAAATNSDADADVAGTAAPGAHPRQMGAAHAAPARLLPYVTVGLTQDEVIAIEGTPTGVSNDKLVYQGSEIDFADGKVSGWKIDPVSAPIRVKLWPTGPVDPDLDSFGVGSSKNVVLVVQGTPTAFTEDTFRYGGSEVYFQYGRVVSWKVDPAWPLRIAPR
jgi:hypothetical protein